VKPKKEAQNASLKAMSISGVRFFERNTGKLTRAAKNAIQI
jgi:hypothetical protein